MPVLRGNKNFYDYEGSDIVSQNVRQWLEYGLLEIGAYTPIRLTHATSGLLKRVQDERFGGEGRVYEGLGPSWAWEAGVSGIGCSEPVFQVSGVYVNNTFYPTATTSGTYAHKVDYRQGRIIFDSSISSSATVRCEYVIRDIGVYAADSPQWKIIIDEYEKNFDRLDTLSPSGMASILKNNRVWLPSVFVDVLDVSVRGLQLGGGEINTYSVDYYIFSDRPFSNRRLMDLIANQKDKVLTLYDINSAPAPLRYDGTLASGALNYRELSDRSSQYFWTYGHISNTRGYNKDNITDLYMSQVNHTIDVDRYLSTY